MLREPKEGMLYREKNLMHAHVPIKNFLHVVYKPHACAKSPTHPLRVKWSISNQGSQKVLSSHLGQVNSLLGQVTFHSHLTSGQGITEATCQLNH